MNGDDEKLTLSVTECAKKIGISRPLAYQLVKEGRLPSIRIGEKRLVIPKVQLEKFLAGQQDATGTRYVFPRINQ